VPKNQCISKIMIKLSCKFLDPIYDKPRKGDIHTSQADISLAEKLLSWTPKISLEVSLKKILFQ